MKKMPALVCFIVFVLTSTAFASDCRVTILHFNDLHGYLKAPKKGLGGADRIAALIGRIDNENELAGRHTLLFFGGDLISGTPVSEEFKGRAEFKFLKAIGTEAMVFGNHDFDFGLDALKQNLHEADFPVLGANIIDKTAGKHLTTAVYVFPLGPSCRVGVMGLVTARTPAITGGDLGTLIFDDPVEVAENYIADLKEQSEITVALAHLYENEDARLAKSVPGFDVIVAGHDHMTPEKYCEEFNGVNVCETPSRGEYLGRIDIAVKSGRAVIEKTELIPVDKKAGRSKEIKTLLQPYFDVVLPKMNEVIGRLDRNLYYRPEKGTPPEENLLKFTAGAFMRETGADAAFINVGGVRKDLKKGKVRRGDVFAALPFKNIVGSVALTGGEIAEMMTRGKGVGKPGKSSGGARLVWAGVERTESGLVIGGRPLDTNKTYKTATWDFLAKGGDEYEILAGRKFTSTGKVARDVVGEYIVTGDR